MIAAYDIEILPTVFFDIQEEKQKLLSSTTLFRKRTASTIDEVKNNKFNMTSGNLEGIISSVGKSYRPGVGKIAENETISKVKYDLLVEQNKLKDEKISNLEGQIKILREKNEELNKILGLTGEVDSFMETTKLNEVTNQYKEKRRIKK